MSGRELTVCSTGRCGRIIDSLTFVDTDEQISKSLKSMDIIRNEALSKSYNILQKEIMVADIEIQNEYNTGVCGDIEKMEKFEIMVKDKIIESITKDYPDLPTRSMDNIINDCTAGIYR